MKRVVYIAGMAVLACNPLGTIVVLCLLVCNYPQWRRKNI